MEKTKLLIVAVISLLLINIGTLSFLWIYKPLPPHFPPPPPNNEPAKPPLNEAVEFIIRELHFNSDQEAKFENLRHQHREQVSQTQDSIVSYHSKIFDLLQSNDTTQAKIFARKIADQTEQVEMFTFSHFAQIRALCDENQMKRFDEMFRYAFVNNSGLRQQLLRPMPPPNMREMPPQDEQRRRQQERP